MLIIYNYDLPQFPLREFEVVYKKWLINHLLRDFSISCKGRKNYCAKSKLFSCVVILT